MGVKWTKQQQQVIDLRDRNILVSAAAGSGKTAVLVERIITMLTDEEHPVNVDELLIVTFTEAAAGEMKERIRGAIEKALEENPENEHLKRQATLIHNAQITTIHSFCLSVIRDHFHVIDIDPGFRTAEEGELKLLRHDVLDELMEEKYAQKEERFLRFSNAYGGRRNDKKLEEMIERAYDYSRSYPDGEGWLDSCVDAYRVDCAEDLEKSDYGNKIVTWAKAYLEEAKLLNEQATQISLEIDGPAVYEEALKLDAQTIRELLSAKNYNELSGRIQNVEWSRFASCRDKTVSKEKIEAVKDLREQVKGIVSGLKKDYFYQKPEEMAADMQICLPYMEELVGLVKCFSQRFDAKKRQENVIDFSDMEQFALRILAKKTEEGFEPSEVAKEYQDQFREIMIDEYQDSNLIQETILTSISGVSKGKYNIFMVGDVKQSIYSFRLSRPELFMEKYEQYSLTDSTEQRIDLHKNFRSRSQVLDSANFIFRQIMGTDLGGIAYDKAAALYPGAVFPEGNKESFLPAEVLLVEKDSEELEDLMEGKDARELEALAISHRIKEIVGKELVLDKETKEYRPAKYGDIVILLRTASGWSETFTEVLSAHGIPVYAASKTGYFSALEVVTILNYLQVCDNPLQDIPLTGVLRSPLVGCTTQELAVLREKHPKGMLYDSVLNFLEEYEGQERTLYNKLHGFIVLLNEMRDLAVYTPVHELILEILRRTGYGNYAKALPNGAQRSANLAMLVEKAMDYEKTSYRGLFNFVRYIEHLQKYEVDYGEVNLSGAGEGSVEIMTIHKSKGLEFPIVILAGMGKQFNMQDLNARLLIHPDYGLGADAILPDRRMIVSTLYKQVIRRKLLEETLGEEIRVLYVALTRAKEKLIMTGTIGNLEKRLLSLYRFRENEQELLPAETRLNGKTYWDYVLPALARHRCMDELFEEFGLLPSHDNLLYDDPAEFQVKRITARTLTEAEVVEQAAGQMEDDILDNWDCEKIVDPEIRAELEKRFGFVYPYEYRKDIPVKVSVSDLKKKSYHEDTDIEEAVYFEPDIVPLVPRFIEEKKETEEAFTGSARGTAYHRVMECLEYNKTDSAQLLKEQIDALVQSKKMSEAEAECIRISDIQSFVNGTLGQRMKVAALSGLLFREQPFVISRSAAEIDEAWDPKERVLVQGIIDAYFLEGDEIVLVDYKTDRVRRGEEQKLVDLYHTQLEDYAQALHRMTGRRVKEKYIYSFTLKKEILLG